MTEQLLRETSMYFCVALQQLACRAGRMDVDEVVQRSRDCCCMTVRQTEWQRLCCAGPGCRLLLFWAWLPLGGIGVAG